MDKAQVLPVDPRGSNDYRNGVGRKPPRTEIICRCNNVDRATIERAIVEGAHTLNQIFDSTSAGVGPCGGSCRRKLGPLLDGYLQDKCFPQKIVEDRRGKVDPARKKSSDQSE